jgi:hypothetical protein
MLRFPHFLDNWLTDGGEVFSRKIAGSITNEVIKTKN